ncbi:MAG TPA: class I SAM-dependent methyltransferase [Acidimicrobiales bacterium]|jgi:SAM-dependent methyltransferase|nr:class I SAM-dependent methyltransferase [Acidimicrobiales bacterium]
MADSPYPELKRTHTAARTGTPWRDRKPPPAATVWNIIQGYGNYWLLVAALELGVFDALERTGPVRVEALAEDLGVSTPHLQSLLDSLVALAVLDQVREVYELNDTAERYLTSGGAASMAALVRVAPGPHANWLELAGTIRKGRPASPIEEDPAAFYVPLVRATFPTQRRVAMFAARTLGFARAGGAPRVLDLGAGGAPWTIALLEAHTSATAVVNDLPGVIEVAEEKVAEHGVAPRCEFRPGDFRTLAFERGAYDIVVLGHVCRTEGRDGAPELIGRAFASLVPGGRVLIADYFTDNARTLNPFAVLMGATMMASTEHGFTFTHEQYVEWLHAAGFRPVRLIEPIGFNQVFVATKPFAREPGAADD